jgi:hypothetical protein
MDIVTRLADTEMALATIRVWRRLLVMRVGGFALLVVLLGFIVPGLSLSARWVPVAILVALPAVAWCRERQLAHRLSRLIHTGGLTRSSTTGG